MKTVVCDRKQATGATYDKPWAVISIHNPGMAPVDFACPNLKGVLYLEFDDTDKVNGQLVVFNMDMARQVWDFIQGLGEVDTLLIHCLMGLSRSPGIAAAVDKALTGDDMKWFTGNDGKVPNRRVYTGVLHVAYERGLIVERNDDSD